MTSPKVNSGCPSGRRTKWRQRIRGFYENALHKFTFDTDIDTESFASRMLQINT